MSRRWTSVLVATAILLVAVAVIWLVPRARRGPEPGPVAGLPGAAEGTLGNEITLYFPGSGRLLLEERRELPEGAAEDRAESVVTALLEGPREEGRFPILPDEVELGGVYAGAGGILYVDLLQAGAERPPAMGSTAETLTVYAIVNSLLANVSGARGVTLLWNGRQQPSFAGHVDTGRPLAANPRLVAPPRTADPP